MIPHIPEGIRQEEIRSPVAEKKDGEMFCLILVYRPPLLKQTVIQMEWTLCCYDAVWKEP